MILNTLDHLGKFDAKGDEGYFVGYSMSSKAFRVFNKRTKKVEENLHIDFLENKLIEKGAGPNWLFDIDTLTSSMNYVPVVVAGTSSTNISGTQDVASQAKQGIVMAAILMILKPVGISNPTATSKVPSAEQVEHAVSLTVETEIPTLKETPSLGNALTLSNRFEDTFGEEADLSNMETSIPVSPTHTFRTHKDHPKSQIIVPVDTPIQTRHKSKEMEEQSFIATIHQKTNPDLLQVRPIGIKWVLKNKKDERGIMIRNKARLVAQGYTQEEGIDYEEVFALVARIEAIRLFLAYASFMGFIVYQMDVKSAFLYGTIDEEVYVMQPPGCQDPEFPDKVYMVEKAMYGLHQAPRACCREFEALMHNKFQMIAMGELTFFLGLKVLQNKDGIFLSQDKYVGDILKKFGYSDFRPDIMFAVCACARHQVTPKECHLHAVKRIFRYLKGHSKMGLWYPKESPFDLVAYSNSVYGGAIQDRKSTTRGCQFLGRRLISWQFKKQTIVATSTTEAEYVATASGYGNVADLLTKPFDAGRFQYLVVEQVMRSSVCGNHILCTTVIDPTEKTEHNIDFHQIVDFLEASHIRYALTISPTVYVSHIRQFWSTARIETTNLEIKILATVDGKPMTISESSLRRHLKLSDEEGISSLPDTELFENLSLMGYNILSNQRFTFQKGQFSPEWKFLIHTIMQCLSPKSTGFNEFSSNIATAVVCLATNRVYNFSKMIFNGMVRNINSKGSKFLMYPRVKAQKYTRRAKRIAQSKALSPVVDEPASLLRDDRQREAFPTVSILDARQDRETINKTSPLPHESSPRVTSLDADEGNQDLEISGLKARVKFLKDKDRGRAEPTQEDSPIKGGIMEIGEGVRADKSTELAASVPTVSGSFPTVSAIFTTTIVVTPYSRRQRGITIGGTQHMRSPIIGAKDKCKQKMVKSEDPKKRKLQEQIDAQVAKEMEEEFARENQRVSKQLARGSKRARLHAEEELKMMIKGLDRSNEVIAKHLQEYEQAKAGLSVGEKIELINELVKYQDHHAKILKGMTLEQLKNKFTPVWKHFEDFVLMDLKEEGKRLKRQGLKIDQGSSKRMKTSEDVSEKKLKEMMRLVPLEEVYVEALQLWTLVKETLSIKQATKDKEKELWVELKRLFEPDFKDQLWTHN
nr:hypothetical protein [Tanacetum cinerariifolium]